MPLIEACFAPLNSHTAARLEAVKKMEEGRA